MLPDEHQQAAQRGQHVQPYITLRARIITLAQGMTRHPFVAKIKADNLLLLAPMIAFNLLMSLIPILVLMVLIPILVLILILVGLVLSGCAPHARDHLIALASERTSNGQFVKLALYRLTSTASWTIILISILPCFWFGSELFVVIAYCFRRIFHTSSRPFLHQRLMAVRMVGVLVSLLPVNVVITSLPLLLNRNAMQAIVGNSPLTPILFLFATVLINWVVAATFFFIIYVVIPGSNVRHVWKGALIAGVLVAVYMAAFPRLAGGDLTAKNDAINAAFALATLTFFYCFSLFLLLGAEINA